MAKIVATLGECRRVGNFIVRDVGTHEVWGIPAELSSRVSAVRMPSDTLDLEQNQAQADRMELDAHPASDTHVQPRSLGTFP